MKKYLPKIFLTLFFIFISIQKQAFALDCVTEDPNYPAPLPSQIFCPLIKVVNLGLILVGAVLIIMIVMGAIKMATALGDPKGLQGANLTWTYAVIGAFIVLASITLISILNNVFDLGIGLLGSDNPNGIFTKIQTNWDNFLETALIFEKD